MGLIFGIEATYVTVMTLRWIILMRGSSRMAAGISFFEILLWVSGLGLVVTNLHQPINAVVYALGFVAGSLAGSTIEEKLAYGYAVVQIVTGNNPNRLAEALRERGLGVTEWEAEGREGRRGILLIVLRRRFVPRLLNLLDRIDPDAFVVTLEPKAFRGGFLTRRFQVTLPR